ncbi:TetR family transcriptional regulator C-terminal domain-containing protein, partial [Flavobacteriaceae bacterium]|nr:TetR family transcriptional regulator C-terminal domain-containing protein [Flavobacteriaceae bacterium]
VHVLNDHKNKLKSLKSLNELKKYFSEYIENLDIQTIDFKEDKLEKIQQRSIKESAWFQLLVTMKFWIDDTSSSFEKTDIFIEKSVKASFDLIDTTPLKSIIDFGKFLFKEKINNN